ncbi:MAG TPA: hypothetical protein VF013_03835 [Candidatus Limnocylindria bacterium]
MMPGLLEHGAADGDVRLAPIERRSVTVDVRGRAVEVRLTRVQGRWLASAQTLEGPTLGRDHSPFLAVSQALEPLGGQLMDVLGAMRDLETAEGG